MQKATNPIAPLILNWVAYSILTVLNCVYLVTKIKKLETKRFHIMMFVILQICYIANICTFIIAYKIGFTNLFLVFSAIWEITMLVAHSIFVIKYYVISLAISEVMQNKEDKYISLKVWSVSISQTIFILLLFIPYPEKNNAQLYFEDFIHALPAYFIVVILTIAFFKLRNAGGIEYSLSKFQIVL